MEINEDNQRLLILVLGRWKRWLSYFKSDILPIKQVKRVTFKVKLKFRRKEEIKNIKKWKKFNAFFQR